MAEDSDEEDQSGQMSSDELLAEASKSPHQEQPCGHVQIIFWAIPLTNIVTGITYLAMERPGYNRCNVLPSIPILIIVWGIIALFSAFFLAIRVSSTWLRIVHVISPIVLIVVSSLIYSVFEPNYDDPSHHSFCPIVLYMIAFCSVTLALVFYGVFCACICRLTPCLYACCVCESRSRSPSIIQINPKLDLEKVDNM